MNEFLLFSDLKKIVAVLSIINLVGEKEENLLLKAGKKSSVPRISVEGTIQFEVPQTFRVIVEGQEMACCGELLDAVGLMLAGFYIFIQFKDLSSTLSFFAQCIFEIDDKTVKDKKVARIRLLLDV